MSIVRCNLDSLNDAKLKIKQCNSQILSDLKMFDNELKEIYLVLNTPNSSKVIPKYIEYFIGKENYIDNYNNKTDKLLDEIIKGYESYSNNISLIAGDKNDTN